MPIRNYDDEIAKERRRSDARVARLKREAAAEQRAIDEKVVELLREQEGDHYDRLAAQAAEMLAEERAVRSQRARRSEQATATPTYPGVSYSVDASFGARAS